MFPTRFSLAEILVLADTAGASGMAPPTSTRISARLRTLFTREVPGDRAASLTLAPRTLERLARAQADSKREGAFTGRARLGSACL